MAIREILTYPDDRLRQVAKPVADPTGAEVRQLAQDLADTMYDAPGVGLAATQIGVALRVAVTDTGWREEGAARDLHVWINPEFLSFSDEKATFEEGCLSVPEIYEEVERPAHVRLRWLDLDGNRHEADFSDFEAVALQHEFDHLDGKLFIDRLSALKQSLIKKKLKKRKKLAAA
ncbi:MAG TPA: peptide deformylase [Mariprofundaceae bacterium]|nr:peptide deformylase [Mariprofundaceae bacterium]